MKKAEIIKELEKLHKELEMSPEEFCSYIKERHNSDIKPEEVYAYRTGMVKSEINWILKH